MALQWNGGIPFVGWIQMKSWCMAHAVGLAVPEGDYKERFRKLLIPCLCLCHSFSDLNVCTHAARSKSMVLGELTRVSRPCSPLDHEKALKAGWLKRQRSIMKNWQLRWFVLRTEALYFYKDQDESKAQVLQNSTYEILTPVARLLCYIPSYSPWNIWANFLNWSD